MPAKSDVKGFKILAKSSLGQGGPSLPVKMPASEVLMAALNSQRRQTSSHRPTRLNADLLKKTIGGGSFDETDLVKESVRQMSNEQLISLMPVSMLKKHQDFQRKASSFKFEAVQVFNRLWLSYVRRLRSIVFAQNKVAVCQFFGTFAPNNLLIFEELD